MTEPEPGRSEAPSTTPGSRRGWAVFWACAWLAVALVVIKIAQPADTFERSPKNAAERLRTILVMVHQDLPYALAIGLAGAAAMGLVRSRRRIVLGVFAAVLLVGAVSVVYAVASVPMFRYLGTPLTYPMLHVAGNLTHMTSSIENFLRPALVAGLVGAPLLYVAAVVLSLRCPSRSRARWALPAAWAILIALVAADFAWGTRERERWNSRDDKGIVRNAHWVFVSSCLNELLLGGEHLRADASFPPQFAEEFKTVAERPPASPTTLPHRPKNVIVVVLESVSTKYLSLYGSAYDTTPRLVREAPSSIVFRNVYSHVGMTANSLVSMLLGVYPPVTWRQLTDDRPDLPGTSIPQVLAPRGYRTAFVTSADNEYVNTNRFLAGRGFDVVWDIKSLGAEYLFTWGGEDRHMVDGVLKFIDQDRGKPFFAMTWTQQTHHPYRLRPGAAAIDFFKGGPLPVDDWDLGNYLNAVREADTQIGRLIDALRERGLADDTLIVITGDHGEAFGSPHPTYGHGPRVWEENLHVPFILWNPGLSAGGRSSDQVGGLCDLGATVCDVIGVPPAPAWQGRSLLDPNHPPRTYFAAANDGYLLAIRQDRWKYIFNATAGKQELYDLSSDPIEQINVAGEQREVTRELRQRVGAWMASQRERYRGLQR